MCWIILTTRWVFGDMTNNRSIDYIHPELDKKITAVSGYYTLTKEACFQYKGRQILYYIGHAAIDTSCCGEGGCVYAFVAGFVDSWKSKKTKEGYDISKIEKVKDEKDMKEIASILKINEKVHQVNFN